MPSARTASADCFKRGSRAMSGSSAATTSTARCQHSAGDASPSSASPAARSRRNSSTRSTLISPPTRHRLRRTERAPAESRSVAARNTSSPGLAGSLASPSAMSVCSPATTTTCGRLGGGADHSPNVSTGLPATPTARGRPAIGPSPPSSSNSTSRSQSDASRAGLDSAPSATTRSKASANRVTTAAPISGRSPRWSREAWMPSSPSAPPGRNRRSASPRVGA